MGLCTYKSIKHKSFGSPIKDNNLVTLTLLPEFSFLKDVEDFFFLFLLYIITMCQSSLLYLLFQGCLCTGSRVPRFLCRRLSTLKSTQSPGSGRNYILLVSYSKVTWLGQLISHLFKETVTSKYVYRSFSFRSKKLRVNVRRVYMN